MSIVRQRNTLVWLILMALTTASWALTLGGVSIAPFNAGLGLLAIAMIKIRLVIRDFMDVRHAPLILRLFTDVWLIVVGVGVGFFYWMAADTGLG